MPALALIAATYNQPRELALFLRSVLAQTFTDFELIIADDGSRAETAELVKTFARENPDRQVRHVWQVDEGFRRAKILNEAVRVTQAPWLVFVDSDTMLHPRFLEDHAQMRGDRRAFMGRRTDLSPRFSHWVLAHPEKIFTAEFYGRLLASAAEGQHAVRNLNRAWRVGNLRLAKIFGYLKVIDILGSNFSVDRALFVEVNGFDEDFVSYFGEDGDFFVRIRNVGAELVGRKAFAVQYHLWHPRRPITPEDEAAYRAALADRSYARCARGFTADEGGPRKFAPP